MCPPGFVKFFFTINGVRIISKKLNKIDDNDNINNDQSFIKLNYLEIESELIVNKKTYKPLVSVKPRTV